MNIHLDLLVIVFIVNNHERTKCRNLSFCFIFEKFNYTSTKKKREEEVEEEGKKTVIQIKRFY